LYHSTALAQECARVIALLLRCHIQRFFGMWCSPMMGIGDGMGASMRVCIQQVSDYH
jgi:hypothetical protein